MKLVEVTQSWLINLSVVFIGLGAAQIAFTREHILLGLIVVGGGFILFLIALLISLLRRLKNA